MRRWTRQARYVFALALCRRQYQALHCLLQSKPKSNKKFNPKIRVCRLNGNYQVSVMARLQGILSSCQPCMGRNRCPVAASEKQIEHDAIRMKKKHCGNPMDLRCRNAQGLAQRPLVSRKYSTLHQISHVSSLSSSMLPSLHVIRYHCHVTFEAVASSISMDRRDRHLAAPERPSG